MINEDTAEMHLAHLKKLQIENDALKTKLKLYEESILPEDMTMHKMGKAIAKLETEVKILYKPVNHIAKGFGRWDLDAEIRCQFACQDALRELEEHRTK